jgi:methyl-accepting chemotaxis protein
MAMRALHLGFGARIALTFGAILLVLTALVGAIEIALNRAERSATQLSEQVSAAEQLTLLQKATHQSALDTLVVLVTPSESLQKKLIEAIRGRDAAFGDSLHSLETAWQGIEGATPLIAEVKSRYEVYQRGMKRQLALIEAGKTSEAAFAADEELLPVMGPALAALDKLDSLRVETVRGATKSIGSSIAQVGIALLTVGAMAVLLAMGAGVWLARSVKRPLASAATVAERIADCDLSVRLEVHGRDEFARLLESLNRMADRLSTVVGRVRQGADSIADSTGVIARQGAELDALSSRQAGQVQQTAAAIEEITASIQSNAANAAQARSLAAETARAAAQGGDAVSQVSVTMNGIAESSRKIVDIIQMIDSIAFQTNISR